jgi:hypothetical protein
MASLGILSVDLALQSANFMNGMRAAAAQTQQSSAAMTSALGMAKGAFGGLAGILSVDFMARQTMAAFDFADAIVDLSDRTGASTKTLQEWRYAAQMSGSSVESADAAMDKFAKNLGSAQAGNKAMAATFKELGVAIDQNVDPALRQFMDGVAKLPTAAMRNAKATQVMGKSAADLTVLLSGGSKGFDTLAQAADAYGIVLEDSLLRNAGQVNDKLDTMKMILNAQMANMIIQNADALVSFANAAIQAGAAAANFFEQMRANRDMSVANGINFGSDIPTVIGARLRGETGEQLSNRKRAEMKTYGAGRQKLLTDIAGRYNDKLRNGADPKSAEMQALRAEGAQIREADARSRQSLVPPPQARITLPTRSEGGSKPKSSTPKAVHEKSAEELDLQWRREWLGLQNDFLDADSDLSTDPVRKAQNKSDALRNDYTYRVSEIANDTGTDQEVREGKKRYTQVQSDQLKEAENALFDARFDAIQRDKNEEIAKASLAVTEGAYRNDLDILQSQASLAKSSKDRRDAALRIVDKEYALEKIQLEAITHSETASKAEKDIAEARLKILDTLRGNAVQAAKDQTAGPLEQYLKNIPNTAGEVNDQLEQIQVEGLDHLQDGLMGVIRGTESVGSAFKNMVGGILDGLMQIALQQAIIKPLGSLLFGGDSGSGGLLGGLLKSIIPAVASKGGIPLNLGARANGGMTRPGNYLTGERGPEIVSIGANANVISNAGIRGVAGAANDNGGLHIHIGNITSNDPDMVRQMVTEGVMKATPMIAEHSSNVTIAKLQRRTM